VRGAERRVPLGPLGARPRLTARHGERGRDPRSRAPSFSALSSETADGRGRGWLLTDTCIPFGEASLPAGLEGTGRLVRVTVESASRGSFAERHGLVGADLGLFSHTALTGEIRLETGHIRVTVYASAFSILAVRGTAGILVLGGVHFFLSHPTLGTALLSSVYVAGAAWLARQVSKAGREVAADAARTLGMLVRGEGTSVFTA